jgi:hypothetical protein
MKLAIMQPYLFPYLGYFQLLAAVDAFVVYDDVTFIKQGWINRNNILVGGKPFLFTVPVSGASSFRTIREIEVDDRAYSRWRQKFVATVDQNYRKATHYQPVRDLLAGVLDGFRGTIGELALKSIRAAVDYLDIRTTIVPSSNVYRNEHLRAQDRVLDICQREGADTYINAIGGAELYAFEAFAAGGITLQFIRSKPLSYRQFDLAFVPSLSIIDVMMFNSRTRIREFLRSVELISQSDREPHR